MTLALNIMMLKSRSKRIRKFGQIAMIPSLFNINEPLVYGAPIALNPILMIPMWINALVLPTIAWFAFSCCHECEPAADADLFLSGNTW